MARLVARVLGEERRRGAMEVDALALSDETSASDLGIEIAAARGSRPRFVWRVQTAALSHSHFIYDFLGMARAHVCLPGLRRPFLVYVHGIEMWEGTRPDRVRTARRADRILVNSAYTLERAERVHGSLPQASVCWLATETDEPPVGEGDDGGPPTVLVLARMDEDAYKGHAEIVAAWPTVAEAVPGARLVLAGGGPAREAVRREADRTPAAASIDMPGFVPEEEIARLWASATVFAMPSRGEGFGLVYVEAMRHGVPVIASTHDAGQEINVDGRTGYNVDLDEPGALADRLIRLLRDRDLARRLGESGRQRWTEHFRFSVFRERFLPHLRSFLGRGPTDTT